VMGQKLIVHVDLVNSRSGKLAELVVVAMCE
jgi:hypothetical protein